MNLYKYATLCIPFDVSSLEDSMNLIQDQLDIASSKGLRLHSIHHVTNHVIIYLEMLLDAGKGV